MKQLYKYQYDALMATFKHDKFLLGLDMGLGKTLVSLYWLNTIKTHNLYKEFHDNNSLIVVKTLKLEDWKRECQDFDYLQNAIIINNKKNVEILLNSTKTKRGIFIISYQKLLSIYKKNKKFINQNWNLILDESQNVKTHNSQITKLFLKNSDNFKKVLLLSGRPFSNHYLDLYSQMKLIDCFEKQFNLNNFYELFTIRDNVYSGSNSFKVIREYRNINTLMTILKNSSYFLQTHQAIELPDKNDIILEVDNSKQYETLRKKRVLLTEKGDVIADNPMSLMHNLKLISSGFLKIEEKYIKLNDNKLLALDELLDSSNYNFSLFYMYRTELHFIKEFLKKKDIKVFEINGEKNELEEGLNAAKNKQRVIFLINYQSGAEGIDGLQHYVNNQIYFSATWSGSYFAQSKKRIDRIGQKNKVTYYYIIAKKSIEKRIYETLNKSQDYTLELFKKEEKIED